MEKKMSPMVRRPLTIEHALLGFLKPGPLHGYQLHLQLSDPQGLGRVWRVKQARLYAWLERLEGDGLISRAVQAHEPQPRRHVYQLTRRGQSAFASWLSTPVQKPRQMRQEFQAKLFFARSEGPEAFRRLLEAQRQACQRWLESQATLAGHESGSQGFAWLVDQYRLGQIQAMLAWLDQCAVVFE